MAIVSNIKCKGCGYQSPTSHSPADPPPDYCHSCAAKRADAKKAEALAPLESLSLEERVKRIEGWIYDHTQNHPQRPVRF